MKKLVLFLGFGLFVFSGNAIAQTCSHGAKTAEAKHCVKPSEAALKAASMDAGIETKVCEKTGSVCFLRKTTSADGTVSTAEVKYDEASASFVSITEGDAKTGKACSSSKKCCAKGSANGKACCKSKGTAAVSENVSPTQMPKSE
jgi:hypothetical protein